MNETRKKHTWKKDDEIEALHNLKYNIQYSRNEWHPYYDIRETQKRKKTHNWINENKSTDVSER